VLVNLGNEFVVVDVTCADNDHVVSDEVVGVESFDVIDGQVVGVVSISLNGLAHHMLSEAVEVDILDKSLLESFVTGCMFLTDLFLHELKLAAVEGVLGEGISEELNCLANVLLEDLEGISADLSAGFGEHSGTNVLDVLTNLGLCAVGRTSEEHFLEKVG
jgi:hypothetical protein